jgi:hypothetical protein
MRFGTAHHALAPPVFDDGVGNEIDEHLLQPRLARQYETRHVAIIVDHGGRIWVESSARIGTVFQFTLQVVTRVLAA